MKLGTRVQIKGLVKAANHNGKTGLVTKALAPGKGRRVGVKLQDDSGTVLAIKIENLVELKTSPGKSAGSPPKGPTLPKERTLKRDNALLREFDGNPDPNVLVLYYHFADRAYDCFNASEYLVQMLRYYEKGLSLKLIVPRKIGANEYFLVGLQHSEQDKNTLCEVAFNCGRSFTGISMLIKKRCFASHKPLNGETPCEGDCLWAYFCTDSICVQRHAAIRSKYKTLYQKIDMSNVVVEKDCVQLL